nr:hypothetical protein GCM10025699_15500 [Microbacterium flavescens]
MRALAHLGKLLRVSEQQKARRRERHRDGRGERELPGLVDHQEVETAARDAALMAEVPRRAADHEAGLCALGGELRDAVLAQRGEAVLLALRLGRLADEVFRDARRDDPLEHVLDDGVRLRDHSDLEPALAHEPGDDVRADVGLARSGGPCTAR